jgi:hypothetical protein
VATEPPNNWQLDKEVSLLRQDIHGLQEAQERQGRALDENGRILREVRDHMLEHQAQRRGTIWMAGFICSALSTVATWAKMTFWGPQ